MNATIELTGTEKQVAYATDIQAMVLPLVEKVLAGRQDWMLSKLPESLRPVMAAKLAPSCDAYRAKVESFIASKTNAGWWIYEYAGEDGPLFTDRDVTAAYTAKSILEQASK